MLYRDRLLHYDHFIPIMKIIKFYSVSADAAGVVRRG